MDEETLARALKAAREEGEFRGRVETQLKTLVDDMKGLMQDVACQRKDLGSLKVRVAGWSSGIAFAVSVGMFFLGRLIAK